VHSQLSCPGLTRVVLESKGDGVDRWQSDEIRQVLDKVPAYTRGLLLAALGTTEGDVPLEFFTTRCRESKTSDEKMGALAGLLLRFGADGLPAMVDALEDRSPHVRNYAAIALAEVATRDTDHDRFYELFRRRMSRPARLRTWSQSELPAAIEFAARTETVGVLATIIRRWETNLAPEEKSHLANFEPTLLDQSVEPDSIDLPATSGVISALRAWRNENGDPTQADHQGLLEYLDRTMKQFSTPGRHRDPEVP
jgi:hypothetical protein